MQGTLKSILATGSVFIIGFSLTACTSGQQKKESNSEAVPVTVGKVQRVQDREIISVSGTVSTPNSPASVCFLVSGKVVFVGPREGEFVKQGQVLARIDPTDFNLSVKGAAAQAASAQAAMNKALYSARPELLEQARIGYERAEDEYRRMKMLYGSKSLAPNDCQKYKAAYEHARQDYEQAKAGGQREDKDQARG